MPKFTKYTHVAKGMASVEFAPGDVVPDWALGKITNRVHDGGQVKAVDAEAPTVEAIVASESEPVVLAPELVVAEVPEAVANPQSEEKAEAEESGEPDFTKPAPAKVAPAKRRPGRPAKDQ
ncbi:hypothetical protein ACTXJU_03560 [Glutamicibacter ardleyensis]|uniref:hypothetical protein n=1 Tax=Glutamicibacter ardleyensis TaxID=225894 RepID=UPI003FD34E56